MSDVEKDAQGQFAKSQGDRHASGVHSAKPTVITGSEDATAHSGTGGEKRGEDWKPGHDPSEMNEGKSH